MHQKGTKKKPERDTGTVWGQKRHRKVARSGKSEIWTPEGVESSPSFSYFLDKWRSKGSFFSMCFAGVVFHRICLNSWAPRTPIIKPKRSRVVQNQGFVNLGKVWTSSPSDIHFDVILETLGRQDLAFLSFMGCLFFLDFLLNPGLAGDAEKGHRGLPETTISKDSLCFFKSTRQES